MANMSFGAASGIICLILGRTILDLRENQRKNTCIPDLLEMFKKASGITMANDKMLLAK